MANSTIRKKVAPQNRFPPPFPPPPTTPNFVCCIPKNFQQGGVHVCCFANFHPREQK